MKDGQQVRFTGEGDQSPGVEAGDIVIVLDEQEHERFKRHGIDLSTQVEINLTEALCGFQRGILTLDGRTLVITSIPGLIVIKPCLVYGQNIVGLDSDLIDSLNLYK